MTDRLAVPDFVLDYSHLGEQVTDYRCAVNGDGTWAVFERTVIRGGSDCPTRLYLVELDSPGEPTPKLLNDLENACRPDWSWALNRIAFNTRDGIWNQDVASGKTTPLPGTKEMFYPTWYPAGDLLLMDNAQVIDGYPHPRTSIVSPSSGETLAQVAGSALVWAGMPTVCPANVARFAFAGQWIGDQITYEQDRNYIFVADDDWMTNPACARVRPLDADIDYRGKFDPRHQGRAPWFSPDGKWIVFESTRADDDGELYALFLQPADGGRAAMQLTDTSWNTNHAKFFPVGSTLLASCLQAPRHPHRGIATFDISPFLRS